MRVGDPHGHGSYGILDDDGQTVLCHECGQRYRALSGHLTRAHNMTTAQYREANGIARTRGLTSTASRDLRRKIGRQRRDTDPRVLAALTSDAAVNQRKAAWPAHEKRGSSINATHTTRREIRRNQVESAAHKAGYEDFSSLINAAHADYQSWWWVAEILGMSQTPLRRWAESEGYLLQPWMSQAAVEALRTIRDHLQQAGNPHELPHGAARWVTSRRWEVRNRNRKGPADKELDRLMPGWDQPVR